MARHWLCILARVYVCFANAPFTCAPKPLLPPNSLLPAPSRAMHVQYVVVRQDGRLEWEPGENRRIHVPLPGLAAALAAAKASVAAEEAAGGLGAPRPAAAGRKLSAAEVYKRQESEQQLEPWQQQQQQKAPAVPAASNGHKRQPEAAAAAAWPPAPAPAAAATPAAAPAAPAAAAPAPAAAVPADWREVKISTKFSAQFGTFLKAVGAPQQLGAWDVVAAPPLQWAEGDVWSSTLLLPPGQHEFKVSVGQGGWVRAARAAAAAGSCGKARQVAAGGELGCLHDRPTYQVPCSCQQHELVKPAPD